jgi:hypothetical protein
MMPILFMKARFAPFVTHPASCEFELAASNDRHQQSDALAYHYLAACHCLVRSDFAGSELGASDDGTT